MLQKENMRKEMYELASGIIDSAASCVHWNESGGNCYDCVYANKNSLTLDNPRRGMLCSALREEAAIKLSFLIKDYIREN